MIEFTKNVEKILPYNRPKYREYLDAAANNSIRWYGVSFQLPGVGEGKEINFKEYVEKYLGLFKRVVLKLDNGSLWIVNHDDKDLDWFRNDADNLPHLRTLFKQNHVPNTFKGALIFSTDELLESSMDLISYPYVVLNKKGYLYKNLDISYGESPVIIKISGHLNIDFLSTDKGVLAEIVNENYSNVFIVKEYRGNSD